MDRKLILILGQIFNTRPTHHGPRKEMQFKFKIPKPGSKSLRIKHLLAILKELENRTKAVIVESYKRDGFTMGGNRKRLFIISIRDIGK